MNATEERTYQWLVAQGYTPVRGGAGEPDFLVDGTAGFEVKTVNTNAIAFTPRQVREFSPDVQVVVWMGDEQVVVPFGSIRFWCLGRGFRLDEGDDLAHKTSYMPEALWARLGLKLFKERKTYSAWVREMAEQYVAPAKKS